MFTDICKSTNLVEAIGDEAWEDVLRWHDGMLRDCFAGFRGEEIKHAGDGFFVAFPDASSAIDCAIGIQRRLAEHRRDHGFSPQVRIGLHAAEATRRGGDYGGRGVHVAARIGALAGAGEILVSRETAPNGDWNVSQPREVALKGIAPVETFHQRG
jgi:class 3 adenylate cyclase